MLWTFSAAQTLPSPEIEARPGDRSITLTIVQGGECDDKALVHYWRVSHCASSSDSQEGKLDTPTTLEGGSGDEGEEYYDYYDDDDRLSRVPRSSSNSMACVNNLHRVTDRRGVILIDR